MFRKWWHKQVEVKSLVVWNGWMLSQKQVDDLESIIAQMEVTENED